MFDLFWCFLPLSLSSPPLFLLSPLASRLPPLDTASRRPPLALYFLFPISLIPLSSSLLSLLLPPSPLIPLFSPLPPHFLLPHPPLSSEQNEKKSSFATASRSRRHKAATNDVSCAGKVDHLGVGPELISWSHRSQGRTAGRRPLSRATLILRRHWPRTHEQNNSNVSHG